MNMRNSNEALTMDSIRLMASLSGSIHSSLTKSSDDIQQVMGLLDQTIEQLIQHFLTINSDLQKFKENLNSENHGMIFSKSEDAIQNVVTDLQFHDIANQLLNRVVIRFKSLQNVLSAIQADANLITTPSNETIFTDYESFLQCTERLIKDTQDLSQSNISASIRPTPMSGGEIELF